MRTFLGVALALYLAAPVPAQTHLVVVSGLGGEAKYSETFYLWATTFLDAALDLGLPESNVVYLAEKVERDPERIAQRSTRENVIATVREVAARSGPTDQIFILLIGHGTTRDGEPYFNLPGPDMSANDFAIALEAFPSQTIIFVNAASASGEFVGAISGNNRAVITATRSGYERHETFFARFFVEAFIENGADVDKDERVSVLEAFTYARREVARMYEAENRLLSEHALLDDNGDGEGTGDPDPQLSDGALARTLFLTTGVASLTAVGSAADDPELAALYETKRQLELQIADLRQRKEEMQPAVYDQELERLLLDLAKTTRSIREREDKGS